MINIYIDKNELKLKEKLYIGSTSSGLKFLKKKLKILMNEKFNCLVICRGVSFHNPNYTFWLIHNNTNNTTINKFDNIYIESLKEEVKLYRLSRQEDYEENIDYIVNDLTSR